MPKVIDNRKDVEVKAGKHIIFFNKNYKYIFIINELILGLEFIVGSVFFLFDSLKTAGTILFIIGSVQFFLRPVMKILHAISLRKESGE
ncbi:MULTISPECIES: YrhK family protein [Sporosarcina]|uniref:YrhK family protein n=1 Tax=Sporosarcina TaxID=1569 RepID=UPI00058C4D23|nr:MULTISPECIES: YrhK family protein [Sporosarcina]WJY27199.1 YrhK family protein [Sporosarcina sp. 0.2-SM1T-5]